MGEFTPEEVAEGLESGKFLPTDLAWREPMPEWKPLSEFDNLPEVQITPPPLVEGQPPVIETPESGLAAEPAWERRRPLGIIPALYESVRQIFSTPATTFQSMPKTGGLRNPLFFYLILGTLSTWASIAYQAAAYQINPAAFSELPKTVTPSLIVMSQIFTFILAPGFVAISAFLMSGIFHLLLNTLGFAKGTFQTTFRAFCYAAGTASVLQFVPICGGYLLLAAQVILLTIAFREVHRIQTWQASIMATVPILFCCGLLIVGFVVAAGESLGAAVK